MNSSGKDGVKGLVAFFVQAANTRFFNLEKLCEFSLTSCQAPPPLVSFLAKVAALALGQGGPGGSCRQNPREERDCAGTAGS